MRTLNSRWQSILVLFPLVLSSLNFQPAAGQASVDGDQPPTGQESHLAQAGHALYLPLVGRDMTGEQRSSSPGVTEAQATAVPEFEYTLAGGEKAVFEIRNASAGTLPALFLFDESDQLVASAGGKNARLAFTPASTGNFKLIVLPSQPVYNGAADVFYDDQLSHAGVEIDVFWGRFFNLRAGETLETVRLPNGAGGGHILYILAADGFTLLDRKRGGGVAGGARYTVDQDAAELNVIVSIPATAQPGMVRVVRNDADLSGHDPDGDGLGRELEDRIGTCDQSGETVWGFDCSVAVTPADTDGDGLSDRLELTGEMRVWERSDQVRVHESIALPLWGANPRHKDMFIEMDFMRRCYTENESKLEEFMTVDAARHFSKIYGDGFITDPARLASHAAMLKNPDGKAGIAVHLDTGVDPETTADATIYGNWGGYTAVDAIQVNSSSCKDGNGDSWAGIKPSAAWKDNMSPARRGVFRYALGYVGGGGQCGSGFACGFNFHDKVNPAHEWGHSFGIGHSGPDGGDGPYGPNCKPNYFSVMNYAYMYDDDIGFADGDPNVAPPLNNALLNEWNAVDPAMTDYIDKLESTFKYYVDHQNGRVDWNRSGSFTEGLLVEAYANFTDGNAGCEYTRPNHTKVPKALSVLSPAMARIHDRLYVFYPVSLFGLVYFSYSDASWNCPTPQAEGCGGASWADTVPILMDAQQGLDAVQYGYRGDPKILIVSNDKQGNLTYSIITENSNGDLNYSTPQPVPGSAKAVGEPALVYLYPCGAKLAYKGQDGNLHTNRITCSNNNQWDGDILAKDDQGSSIPIGPDVSPSLVIAAMDHSITEELYGAFTDNNNRLSLYHWHYNDGDELWEPVDVLDMTPTKVIGRPAMAWMPYNTFSKYPGRLYLAYIRDDTTYQRQVRWMMSYGKVTQTADGKQIDYRMGFDSPFDNVWHYAYGIDLMFELGYDDHLRYLRSARIPDKPDDQTIWFRPKADGISDYEYRNQNDWTVLESKLCSLVVNPGGLVDNPVDC